MSILEPPAGVDRLSEVELARRTAGRLHLLPRFRQRVIQVPLGVGEPVWRDDPGFDLHNHVRELPPTFAGLALRRCANASFSQRLRRDRPLWKIAVIPRLAGGRAAIFGKVHHAMVDGVAAVELGMLMFDTSADAEVPAPVPWLRAPEQPGARIVLDAMSDTALEGVRTVGRMLGVARSPRSTARAAEAVGRAALSVAHDALPPVPPARLNVDISPARTVVIQRLRSPACWRSSSAAP